MLGVAAATLVLPVLACAQDKEAPRITIEELKKRMAEAVVVDVRSAGQFQSGHIPGALSIPLDQIDAHANDLAKSKLVVTYCA